MKCMCYLSFQIAILHDRILYYDNGWFFFLLISINFYDINLSSVISLLFFNQILSWICNVCVGTDRHVAVSNNHMFLYHMLIWLQCYCIFVYIISTAARQKVASWRPAEERRISPGGWRTTDFAARTKNDVSCRASEERRISPDGSRTTDLALIRPKSGFGSETLIFRIVKWEHPLILGLTRPKIVVGPKKQQFHR